ncbi:uncharacterized protein LOC123222814 isoform X2 [Mangifera indica]|uniref:uncharacterized protein LOC123222814 isoform X2 n=1 Tax=Mangifera indica TaxID=29780 RepID=UPI001CFA0E15|nr:uncharacterized protein LOC123222814 isoform X2 [Mangifera indica]
MYADRVEATAKRSVKDRLNGNSTPNYSTRRRSITGKRQRQDDKWEHDLYDDDERQVSMACEDRMVGVRDLRLKLQKKSIQQVSQSGKSTSGVQDLREKLSGTMNSQLVNSDPPKPNLLAAKPARKSVAAEASETETRRVADPALRKKVQQKVETSVGGFLRSLGLEKYSITFQAEVDMTALVHMTDEDLKAIGIPMGPRKKILLALESRG